MYEIDYVILCFYCIIDVMIGLMSKLIFIIGKVVVVKLRLWNNCIKSSVCECDRMY